MNFYDEISSYYDSIFKVSNDTVEFMKNSIGKAPKNVLDIACGTGGYTLELEKFGYDLTAVDLDQKMINKLSKKSKKEKNNIKFLQADMTKLLDTFDENTFDSIYCIGNSVVHLDNLDEIRKFFIDVHKLLKVDGNFVFQVINYNRILSKNVKALPTIINEEIPLKFERIYEYEELRNKIVFKTILSVEHKEIKNEIDLFPLRYNEATALLRDIGFKQMKAYGSFKGNNYEKQNSYAMIIEVRK